MTAASRISPALTAVFSLSTVIVAVRVDVLDPDRPGPLDGM